MSEINVKRFVDINIQENVSSSISSTRDTVILFTEEGTSGTSVVVSSMSEANETFDTSEFPITISYLDVYFANGGQKCEVVEGITLSTLSVSDILAYDEKRIIMCFAYGAQNVAAGYTNTSNLATELSTDSSVYGINEKILLTRTLTLDNTEIKNLGVKYSSILGAEMTIAAYLSQIDVYEENSVHDYMFTQETLDPELVSDATFGEILDANMNVDITLANASRNMGGNLKNGADVVNNYVRIILHQTLTDRLLRLLTTKLKDARGIAQIYAAIAQELEIYKTSGYLSTDKIWTKEDLNVSYNGNTYRIIEKGTALATGYVINILPLSSLTDADRAARKAPPIYVILADQYGIRAITINGEVI